MEILILFLVFIIIYNFIQLINLSKIEYFDKNFDGTVCGTENDICSINDETGENSCCKNMFCIRKAGNYEYKVCSKENSEPEKNNINTSFLSRLFTFGNEYDTQEEMDDNTNLTLQLKDMCGYPYKINLNPYFSNSIKRKESYNLFNYDDQCLL